MLKAKQLKHIFGCSVYRYLIWLGIMEAMNKNTSFHTTIFTDSRYSCPKLSVWIIPQATL